MVDAVDRSRRRAGPALGAALLWNTPAPEITLLLVDQTHGANSACDIETLVTLDADRL
jgi:hypothetical protein